MKKIIIFALLCVITQGIWAQTTYKYYECSWNGSQVVRTEQIASGEIDDISTAKYASGGGLIGKKADGSGYDYFVATKSCTIPNGLTVSGTCKLILLDGVTITVKGNGIEVLYGSSLNIYAQSYEGNNIGKLISRPEKNGDAAIGGKGSNRVGGIVINGGIVEAYSGEDAAGIGGGRNGNGGTVVIYDGNVTAQGGEDGAGIGGGYQGNGDHLIVYGGTVKATGGIFAAGIGSGRNYDGSASVYKGGTVEIFGGKVTANGGEYGAGIGGGQDACGADVIVAGGHVETDGGMDAAGIGSGESFSNDINGGSLKVTGGYVYADGTSWGAGIGGGEDAKGANVEITGGTVVAWAGSDAGEKNGSAIGSEDGDGRRGSLHIGDKMMVHAGQNPDDANGHLFSTGERVPACFFRPYCRVEPCDHQGATFTVSGITSNDTHTRNCSHCLDRSTENHNFVDGTCTVCGVSTTIYTINIYLPAAVDGGYTDGVYATEPLRQNVVAGTVNLPSPNVTHLPNGVEFAGWAVGTPEEVKAHLGIDHMSFWIQSGEDVLSPGSSYAVSGNVSLTARYKAVCITLADAADNGETLYTYNDKKTQSVTLTGRTLYKDGSWDTLCLPFNVTISGSPLDGDGVDVRTLSGSSFEKGTLTLNFTEAGAVTKLEAGKPYLIKWENTGATLTQDDLVFSNVTIHSTPVDVTTDYVDFVGIFSPEVIYDEESQTKLYVGADNTLYYPTSEGFAVNSCRAYFQLKVGLVAGEPSTPVSCAFNLDFGDVATGISELRNFGQNAQTDAWYTLDGRRLSTKPATSGIYINNGRKVVIK